MNLKLSKDLIVFDIESTGLDIAKDRIIELSMLKIRPDGSRESKTWVVNPGIWIPLESSKIHGFFNDDVKDKPSFEDLAQEIFDFIGDADLAGYNSNRFDIPVLVEAFLRMDMDLNIDQRRCIDVMRIYMKKEPRNLEAALRYYCDKDLENAHSAEADVAATFDILDAQVNHYEDLENDADYLAEFSKDGDFVDFARRMYVQDGEYFFNFGKHKGRRVFDVLEIEPQYYDWIQKADFPLDTKNKLKKIKLEMKGK